MSAARAAAAAVAAALLLGGCSVGDRLNTVKQEAGKAVLPSIAIGACTNLDLGTSDVATEVDQIPPVPCDKPHGWEAYAEKQFGIDDAFPGDAVLAGEAEQYCVDSFEGYVGADYDTSSLEMQYLYPTEQSWTRLVDRTITCLVGTPALDLVGSVKGSGK
ncbi:hypothetical protein G7070_01175 [Propioniciclava coleopterorum]|uniref:Septum formation-related domain-containing protein n=1 Tax=Propioniciclava coleopterorum TaxID=2714937 RepID=A0A6G7Y2U0_9ACTN|nr:septum formation family protein [Propioniciclava coleopterorum]QIK71150.1 hypothetical protein G7070_01175 [Propioniciclava coleopterorum]